MLAAQPLFLKPHLDLLSKLLGPCILIEGRIYMPQSLAELFVESIKLNLHQS